MPTKVIILIEGHDENYWIKGAFTDEALLQKAKQTLIEENPTLKDGDTTGDEGDWKLCDKNGIHWIQWTTTTINPE